MPSYYDLCININYKYAPTYKGSNLCGCMLLLFTKKANGLCLPADSPVLIQSGFAILAIAKISAARNRHPEMMVSLSISSADEPVNDVGKCGGRCPNGRHSVGCYQSNVAPFNNSSLPLCF